MGERRRLQTYSAGYDGEHFCRELNLKRTKQGLSWRQVAAQAGVPASTLTRMMQGLRPDIDSFARLVSWFGGGADVFLVRECE